MDAEPDPLVLRSALRHGVTEEDMLHALRNEYRHYTMGDGLVMVIGSDTTGRLIEVGVVEWHGTLAVAHAMSPARDRFLR